MLALNFSRHVAGRGLFYARTWTNGIFNQTRSLFLALPPSCPVNRGDLSPAPKFSVCSHAGDFLIFGRGMTPLTPCGLDNWVRRSLSRARFAQYMAFGSIPIKPTARPAAIISANSTSLTRLRYSVQGTFGISRPHLMR